MVHPPRLEFRNHHEDEIMRCFKLACLFGILVASFGCVSDGMIWNQKKDQANEATDPDSRLGITKNYRNWVKPQGFDDRAKEIEKSLGVK